MTLTLAIDTSTVVCVALARDGVLLASGRVDDTRAHVEQLMPLVQRLIADANVALTEVTDVAVGVGPGPFTGLRVGVVTALTLGHLAGATVRGVCSLDVVARQHVLGRVDDSGSEDFVAAIDARRKEVYWARYDHDGTRVDGPFVGPPADLPQLPIVGPGAAVLEDDIRVAEVLPLDVAVLAQIASTFADEGTEPLYLRKPDADMATSRKSALQPGVRLSLKRPQGQASPGPSTADPTTTGPAPTGASSTRNEGEVRS